MSIQVNSKHIRIWIADDDLEDFQFIKKTFEDNQQPVSLSHIENGQYLIDILKAQSKFSKFGDLPNLILLDLNMPRKNGLDVLKEIKENPLLCKIPVIIFTTSRSVKDIERSYELGASCYLTKPQTSVEWTNTLLYLGKFWIDCVQYAV